MNRLAPHQIIAWDMDGTLIDGRNSACFRTYIATHPEKQHHVITFRDRTWADQIMGELGALGLDSSLIASVENCPELLHDIYQISRNPASCAPKALADHAARQFVRWKGRKARELGCTILVDDLAEWVVVGCQENDVTFLDATLELIG
jgi:hypothetical protein